MTSPRRICETNSQSMLAAWLTSRLRQGCFYSHSIFGWKVRDPSSTHGIRVLIEAVFANANRRMNVCAEIQGFAMLMEFVGAGLGVTSQPGGASVPDARRHSWKTSRSIVLLDENHRHASRSGEEFTAAGLAARAVLLDVALELVRSGNWAGATFSQRRPAERTLVS